jgi:aminoglycoside/choline kinase family phosphotransferase
MEKPVLMKFEQNVILNGVSFTLVKIQRDGLSAIYKSEDKTKILRIGDKVKIEKDLANHKKLIQQGYPVSEIVEESEDNDLGYFIEESLGENLFGQLFRSDYEQTGEVSDENFDLLIKESKKLLTAQIKNSVSDDRTESTIKGVHLDWLIDELPDEKDKIEKRLVLALQRLKNFPFVFSHGDYNPYNTFPDGIIDFEDGFYAPILFDVYGLLVYPFHFPTKEEIELEINGGYKYSEEQRKRYLDEMDKVLMENGFPKGSDFFEEIKFLKGIWLAVRMQKWPKMQQYRYKIFKELLD